MPSFQSEMSKELRQLRKPSMEALIRLFGGAGRHVEEAEDAIGQKAGLGPGKIRNVRGGMRHLSADEAGKLKEHLERLAVEKKADQATQLLLQRIDLSTLLQPSGQFRDEVKRKCSPGGSGFDLALGPKSSPSSAVSSQPSSQPSFLAEKDKHVEAPQEAVLSGGCVRILLPTGKGLKVLPLPEGCSGLVYFQGDRVVEVHIDAGRS